MAAGDGYTAFERELLHAVFDTSTPAAQIFREQIAQSTVVGRRYSGWGSFTDISVHLSAPTALGVCGTPAEQVWVEIWRPGMDGPAGCVIFVDKAGFINCLEVYTHASTPWLDDPTEWRIISNIDKSSNQNPFDIKPQT